MELSLLPQLFLIVERFILEGNNFGSIFFIYKASVKIKIANTQQWMKHFLLTLRNSIHANARIMERIKKNQADQWGQSAAMRSAFTC